MNSNREEHIEVLGYVDEMGIGLREDGAIMIMPPMRPDYNGESIEGRATPMFVLCYVEQIADLQHMLIRARTKAIEMGWVDQGVIAS